MKKAIPFIFALALCVAFVSACSSTGDNASSREEPKYAENAVTVQTTTLNFFAKDFDSAKKVVEENMNAVGGRKDGGTERSYADGGFFISYTLIVPTDKKEQFVNALKGAEEIEITSETTQFYTVYNDSASLTAKKNALSEIYQSLDALLSDDSQDKVSVIKEMSSVNEQIKELQTRIDRINELSGFSTVYITVNKNTVDVEGIVASVLCLVAVSGLTVATVLTVIRIKRKKAEKKNETDKPEDSQEK